jgi:hydrogenase nickel incorporation protein HypB
MCTVCGCGTETIEGQTAHEPHGHHHHHDHDHDHHHGHDHDHAYHHHDHPHHAEGLVDAGAGLAGVHVPGLSQERIVRIERDILSKNNNYARQNRDRFARTGTFALNLVSSPGSGKTTLLCRTIDALKQRLPIAVIEGDQQTSNDAERIRATGVKAVQVNTGKGCHLDAHMAGPCAGRIAARTRRRAVHRECRQSGLPGGVRPWRGS